MSERGVKWRKNEYACAKNRSKADTSLQISVEQNHVSSPTMIGDVVLTRFQKMRAERAAWCVMDRPEARLEV